MTALHTAARRRIWALGATLLSLLCITVALGVRCNETTPRILICAVCFFITCTALSLRDLLPAQTRQKGWVTPLLWSVGAVSLAFGGALLYSCAARPLLASLFFAPDAWYFEAMLLRAVLLLPFTALGCSFFFFSAKKITDFLFTYRWAIALSLFVLLVACKINLSSVGYFHTSFQQGSATPFTMPLFGIPRGIRSDEWLVDLPRKLAAEFSNYEKYNEIVRGTRNHSISSSYLYRAYSALANPLNLGFYLFGSQYGLSFLWCSTLILSFMVSFELSYILSGKHRLCALLGGVLIGLSPFSLWWSICTYFISVQGVIVLMYYFLHTERRRTRILCAIGIGEAGAMYVCALYPAWQVPLGYIALGLIAWLVIDAWKQIRAMRLWDWAMVGGALVFMASIVLAYLSDSAEYMQAITETVYPGERFSAGGFALDRILLFLQTPLYPFLGVGNSSESSAVFSMFPLPMILATVAVCRQLWRRRTDKTQSVDSLLVCLLLPTLFLTLYCTTGIPAPLASLTMMSYSLPERAAPFVGLLQVYLLLRLLFAPKEERLPWRVGAPLSVLCVVASIYFCRALHGAYMPIWYLLGAAIGTALFGYVLLCPAKAWLRNGVTLVLCGVLSVSGLCVLPLSRGTDALTEKPLSYAISDLVAADPTAKWCSYGDSCSGQFLIANGAPCITSVNYMPNMALWQTLDPTGQYEFVYNRYAHVTCTLTAAPTSFDLLAPDHMHLKLSYGDLGTAQVKYLLGLSPLSEDSPLIDFALRYQEQNVYIYEVLYL